MNKKKILKYIMPFLIIFFVTIILEVFIFNFRSILSLNSIEEQIDDLDFGEGIVRLEDNKYAIINYDKAYLELKNINKDVSSLKLDFQILNKDDYIKYNLEITDAGNEYYYNTPSRYIYDLIQKSKVVNINASGDVSNIKINLNKKENQDIQFKINGIYINSKTPFNFSITRIILAFFIFSAFWLYRSESEFYDIKFDFKSKKQKIFFICLIILQSTVMIYYVNSNKVFKDALEKNEYSNQLEYQDLARALYKGQLYLDVKPSDKLKDMKNPYDFTARNKKCVDYEWDKSYYNGKYYVYFGVVPVILTYLPYYAITGTDLSNITLVTCVLIISMIGVFLFLKELVKKYFPNTKLLIFTILLIWIINCSGFLSIAGYPSLYNVPVLFSLMFTYYGLYFWMSSIEENRINRVKVTLGSLCMALIAGCRPQFILGSFFSIPIFWNYFIKNKNKVKNILSFTIPYIIIAILLMIYNKLRFDSVFDFGSNYNITTNDMTKRGFNIDRIGLGIFTYLFQLPNIIATFPFLVSSQVSTNYIGTTIYELEFGGLISTNLLLLLNIFIYKFKNIISPKLYFCSLFCILCAIVIVIVDTNMAGILTRYKSDFAWLLFISTIIIVFSIFEKNTLDKRKMNFLSQLMFIVIFLSLVYQFLYMFDDQFLHNLIKSNPGMYFKWNYLLQWWL